MRHLNMMTWRIAAGQSAAAPPPPTSVSNATTAMDDMQMQMMQGALVFTAVLMAILGGTLSVVGMERLIRGRFTLFSMVRFLLRFTFILFLPLLSYMRANATEGEVLFVLLWLLLIELFRKKVEAMVADGSFSRSASRFRLMGHSDEVTRLVWIGYLIYSNVDWQSKKFVMMPLFAILWSLAVAKLIQRVLNEWKAQDSLSAAGSANIIAGYMQHVLEEDKEEEEERRRHSDGGSSSGSGAAATGASSRDPDLDTVMGKCRYVVMGEEKLVLNKKERRLRQRQTAGSKVLTTPHCGYGVGTFPREQDELKHVHLLVDLDNKVKNLVTVKDVWPNLGRWLALCGNRRPKFIDHMRLMCLSFSLFKLLRRRFEHYPMVEVGSKMARRLMVEGLLNDHEPAAAADNASRAFRVIQMELDFLDNYYQAGVPVVMSAPWLFFINFLSSLLFVSIYVLAVAILVFITHDNSVVTYFTITMLLVMTLLAVEITDFLTTYLFSNWFLVHLLCLYVAPGGCLWNFLVKPIICCFIAYRLFVFYSLRLMLKLTGRPVNEKKMKVRQVSILQVCEPVHKMFAWASKVTLPSEAKVAIVKDLKKGINNLDTGGHVILPLDDISGFDFSIIRGKTATEIILACHLATELLEVKHGKPKKKKQQQPKQKEQEPQDWDHQKVATTLSRYCMYLVARAPELLPDDERWVSDRYGDVKSCLKEASRRCCYSTWCCPWSRTGRWKAVAEMKPGQLKEATAQAGVQLYQQLEKGKGKEDSAAGDAWKWKVMAEFWVKLLIYLAPSNDVEGHAKVLASSGSDLITCLWALCTHAGIKRHPAELCNTGSQQV